MALRNLCPEDARNIARDLIRESALTLTPAAEADLIDRVAPALRFDVEERRLLIADHAGNPVITVVDGAVVEVNARDHVAVLAGNAGPAPVDPRDEVAIERANERAAIIMAASRDNPWSRRTWNLSRQGVIENLNPELATRLERDAQAQS
jgi:hypothetical protein